jgi:hypothetical protein
MEADYYGLPSASSYCLGVTRFLAKATNDNIFILQIKRYMSI